MQELDTIITNYMNWVFSNIPGKESEKINLSKKSSRIQIVLTIMKLSPKAMMKKANIQKKLMKVWRTSVNMTT